MDRSTSDPSLESEKERSRNRADRRLDVSRKEQASGYWDLRPVAIRHADLLPFGHLSAGLAGQCQTQIYPGTAVWHPERQWLPGSPAPNHRFVPTESLA